MIMDEKISKRVNRIVLAEGETTGHCHTMIGDLTTFEIDGTTYIKADGVAEVIHQEHTSITVDPGIYRLDIVKEYDHFQEETNQIKD